MTTPEAHQAGCDGMLQTVDRIERDKLADRVTLYRRGGEAIYHNELRDGQWTRAPQARSVVEAERARPMTLQELQGYAKMFDQLLDMLVRPERQANADEIRTMENLCRQAAVLVAAASRELPSAGVS